MNGKESQDSGMSNVMHDVKSKLDKKEKNKVKPEGEVNDVEVIDTEQFLVEYLYKNGSGEDDSVMIKADRDDLPNVLRYIEENIEEYANESEEFNNENMHIYRLGSEVKVKGYHVEIEDL